MIDSVTNGRPGSAMMGFAHVLSDKDIVAVVDFIQHGFIDGTETNTYYHTAENGWANHKRYKAAFPFARGEIAIDSPWESLTPEQQQGKRLFMSSCIICHEQMHEGMAGILSFSHPQ